MQAIIIQYSLNNPHFFSTIDVVCEERRSGRMISKPVMQNTVDTIASIAGRKLCVYDTDGQLIACSGSGESAADKRSTSVRQ